MAAVRRGRPRSAARSALLLIMLLATASGAISATGATFNATNKNDGNIAAPALSGPGGTLTASASDNNSSLSWSGSSVGSYGNGYSMYVATATGANCAGVGSFSLLASTNSTGSSLTDSTTNSGGTNSGSWYCYQLRTGYWPSSPGTGTPTWTSQVNPVQAGLQLGFFADAAHIPHITSESSLTTPNTQSLITTGATVQSVTMPATLTTNSVITITFNAATNQPTIFGQLCLDKNAAKVYIGDPIAVGSSANCAEDSFAVLSGTVAGGNGHTRVSATYSWTNATTLSITITSASGVTDSGAFTATLAAASNVLDIVANESQFVFNFGSNTYAPAYTGSLCFTGNTIYVSETTGAGACSGFQVGQLTGGTLTGTTTPVRMNATYTWSNNNTTLTAMITNTNAASVTITGTWSYTAPTATTQQPVGSGSQFVLHFDQQTNTPTFSADVCFDATAKRIYLADSGVGLSCNGTLGYFDTSTGSVTGITPDRATASFTWAADKQTLTVQLTAAFTTTASEVGTWTYRPAAATGIKTLDATVSLCTPNSGCQPQAT
jgi:hypothetical protein